MKLLFISHSQKFGGAEKCLFEAAVGLTEQGYNIKVVVPSGEELYNKLISKNIEVVILSQPWWVHYSNSTFSLLSSLRKNISFVYRIKQFYFLLKKEKPDYVLSNTLTIPCGAIASKLSGKKHIWFIHELGEEDHGFKFDFGFYISSKIISFTSKYVFVNSLFVLKKFEKYIPVEKITIINYQIDVPHIYNNNAVEEVNNNQSLFNIYIIGQIQSKKGQLTAIKAYQILKEKNVDCSLTIIGQVSDKNYYNSLCDYIKENDLEVNFISTHLSNPFDELKANPIGLMCSENEALGRITIEYMKLNIPVIGSNSGQTQFIIKDKFNGLLFEKNSFKELAEKILLLINDQHLRTSLTSNAFSFAENNFNKTNYLKGFTDKFK